jgi:subtilase family serine protease
MSASNHSRRGFPLVSSRRTARARHRPAVDALEPRCLLSGSPAGFLPAQVVQAYGIDQIALPPGQLRGGGQTIAIFESLDDPNFVNSTDPAFGTSDLAQFDQAAGLPDPPSFSVIAYDPVAGHVVDRGAVSAQAQGTTEYALDVEWAHAVAPGANLVVVEYDATQITGNGAQASAQVMQFAASLPGVSVVSHSYGRAEFTGEANLDSYFQTPAQTFNPQTWQTTPGHNGVTFVSSSGDGKTGYQPSWPAMSQNVVAVGGTALFVDGSGNYQSEKAWNHSQGGTSTLEPEGAYQDGVNKTGFRQTPDVAMVGDGSTGVAVYDSYANPGTGWRASPTGGTSVSTPLFAGLVAIADQLRADAGLGTLDGATQTLPALYQLPAADFHAISAVNHPNNLASGDPRSTTLNAGYNLFTGLGSPVANLLVPDLAGVHLAVGAPFLTATAGTAFSGVVATFSVSDTAAVASQFKATITWGDGTTSSGTVAAAGGGFSVSVSHTYSQGGRFPLSVKVTDTPAGTTLTAPGVAHVARLLPPPGGLAFAANALTHSAEYYGNLVTAAYINYLGRAPAPSEVAGWVGVMQSGLSDEQLEAGFIGAPEFIAGNGGPGGGWVTALYEKLLGRAPASSEVSGWVTALNGGMTPTAIALFFASSPEREAQRITADYQTYLGRSPEPGIVAAWVNAFESGFSNENVIAGFVGSTEYFQKHFDNIPDWIFHAYDDVLGHDPDPAGFQGWLQFLKNS